MAEGDGDSGGAPSASLPKKHSSSNREENKNGGNRGIVGDGGEKREKRENSENGGGRGRGTSGGRRRGGRGGPGRGGGGRHSQHHQKGSKREGGEGRGRGGGRAENGGRHRRRGAGRRQGVGQEENTQGSEGQIVRSSSIPRSEDGNSNITEADISRTQAGRGRTQNGGVAAQNGKPDGRNRTKGYRRRWRGNGRGGYSKNDGNAEDSNKPISPSEPDVDRGLFQDEENLQTRYPTTSTSSDLSNPDQSKNQTLPDRQKSNLSSNAANINDSGELQRNTHTFEEDNAAEKLPAVSLNNHEGHIDEHGEEKKDENKTINDENNEQTQTKPLAETPNSPGPTNQDSKKRNKGRHGAKRNKHKSLEAAPSPAKQVGNDDKEENSPTTVSMIKSLPAQEVSITGTTKVQIRRTDSSKLLNSLGASDSDIAAIGGTDENASPVIDLLRKNADAPSSNAETQKPGKKKRPKKSKNSSSSKVLSNDDAVNQRAARQFNRAVRSCVERSDPDGIYDLLHDKRNHKFALDANVLETVMKAFVVAAMFDDALYCLRNCALPGTLNTMQTERILQCLPQNLRNSNAYTAADMINALCIATEFDKSTSRTYFMRVVRGIALEFLEEATSARDRICSAPCERLVRSAVCVVDAKLRRGKKATELVAMPGNQLGVFVPDTLENRGIQAGDAVGILPYAGPYPMSAESLDRNMIEATVTGVQPLVLRLQDKTNASLYALLTEPVDGNVYRIDKLANRMGFNRQLAAAVAVASPIERDGNSGHFRRDARRPSPELIRAITAMDENIDRVMMLGGVQISAHSSSLERGELTSTAALCAQAVPWNAFDDGDAGADLSTSPSASSAGVTEGTGTTQIDEDSIRTASKLALEKYGALQGLNGSQSLAVEGAATNRLTLVQGPPGTGKTAVAIRILQHWARLASSEARDGYNPNPILATSDSNIAVDNLVEGCANVGLRVVRLGRPEAVRPELLRYCIDRPQAGSSGGGLMGSGGPVSAFKEKMKNLKNAQVVCCTCIGSGGDILDNMTFERVLVDEATQATEPAVLVPLTRGCRQLVLVGDHCQLPPTVLSTRAEEEGLGVPLFSRMVACGVPPFMLDTQYRMHPAIAMFPSDLFYGGKLSNGVSPPERRPLAGFPWPREEFPVAFVPVNHGTELDDGVSKLNEAEAAAACDAVAALLTGGQCTPSDIAVVTPYAAQVRLIRRLTRKLAESRGPPYVEVSSTDGFQGREKEAVVFSAVRSNDYGAVGFVSDWRRVNVSFTRARRGLIVIGNDQTLRRGDPDTWMPWLAWADAHGVNMDKPGVPRGRYEPEQLRRVRGGTTAAEMLKDVLVRQQAQLKTAERQLEKAEKNAAGHIMGNEENEDTKNSTEDRAIGAGSVPSSQNTLEQDLAKMTNADGCWDDSDDDENGNTLAHSVSKTTLATNSSDQRDGETEDEPMDAWDL